MSKMKTACSGFHGSLCESGGGGSAAWPRPAVRVFRGVHAEAVDHDGHGSGWMEAECLTNGLR